MAFFDTIGVLMGNTLERSILTPDEAGPLGCGPCYNLNVGSEGGKPVFTCGKLESPWLSTCVGLFNPPLHTYTLSPTEKVAICPRGLFPNSVPNLNDAVHIEQERRKERLDSIIKE